MGWEEGSGAVALIPGFTAVRGDLADLGLGFLGVLRGLF